MVTVGEGRHQVTRSLPEERKVRLQAAFTALGLDRVVAGVRSLYMENAGWDNCFLAMAYGEAGALDRLTEKVFEAMICSSEEETDVPNYSVEEEVSRILGIDADHVATVSGCFDSCPEAFKIELNRWLESRNVNVATVMAQARKEAPNQEPRPEQPRFAFSTSWRDSWTSSPQTTRFHFV